MVKVLSFRFQECLGLLTMSNGPVKRDFLDIYLTTSSGVRKFKYTSTMMVIFFLKMFKSESKLTKCKKIFRKYFSFLRYLHLKTEI